MTAWEFDKDDHRHEHKINNGNFLYALGCKMRRSCSTCGDCFECYHFSKYKADGATKSEVTK